MPILTKWVGDSSPLSTWLDDYDPAVDVARIIGDKSTSITLVRGGVEQTAQTMRVEERRGNMEAITAGGVTGKVDALLIGYKGHPSIADTDIQRGDRFAIDGIAYEVVMLVPGLTNSVQAYARLRG